MPGGAPSTPQATVLSSTGPAYHLTGTDARFYSNCHRAVTARYVASPAGDHGGAAMTPCETAGIVARRVVPFPRLSGGCLLRIRDEHEPRCWENEVLGRHRMADEVALTEITPQAGEQVECSGVLDTLRHNAHVQLVAEGDGGADQRRVAFGVACGQAGEEGTIELQLADGETAQVGERGEPRAEVVDRHAQAEVAELDDHPLA